MKSLLAFIAVALSLMVGASGCQKASGMEKNSVPRDQIEAAAESNEPLQPNSAVMYVFGMGCPQCAYNVDLQLLKLEGVKEVKVDMGSGKVTAFLDPANPPTADQLKRAIRNTGFTLVKLRMPE